MIDGKLCIEWFSNGDTRRMFPDVATFVLAEPMTAEFHEEKPDGTPAVQKVVI